MMKKLDEDSSSSSDDSEDSIKVEKQEEKLCENRKNQLVKRWGLETPRYRGVRRKYTQRCPRKHTSFSQKGPAETYKFFTREAPLKDTQRGPAETYKFFFN